MVNADEEARARLFWQQLDRQRRYRTALARSLNRNPAAAKQVRTDWEPVILARLEARIHERDDCDE